MKNKTLKHISIIALIIVIIGAILLTIAYVRIYGGEGVKLPVLIYHNFADESNDPYTVSADRFDEQIRSLKAAGYSSVSLKQIIDYVEKGISLPNNPILITIDDGYESTLSIAAPILEKNGFCATVFMVGIIEGETKNPHTSEKLLTRHFSYEDAQKWVEAGVIDLQSHTYDMHHLISYGTSRGDGMLAAENESSGDHFKKISADCKAFAADRKGRVDTELVALAYPYGYYTNEIDEFLENEGIAVTLTTEERINALITGNANSLRKLGRFNVLDKTSGTMLVLRILKNKLI